MQKSALRQFPEGSAERVIAHSVWQRSIGRRPSMSYLGHLNPKRALALAMHVVLQDEMNQLRGEIGAAVIKRKKSWAQMSNNDIKVAVRHIVQTSSSDDEVLQRVEDELGYPSHQIMLASHQPVSAEDIQARELVRGLGGLVMKNGAMAMLMMEGHAGLISL